MKVALLSHGLLPFPFRIFLFVGIVRLDSLVDRFLSPAPFMYNSIVINYLSVKIQIYSMTLFSLKARTNRANSATKCVTKIP